uniref:Uncharacterized protein n=1 Tax=Acrobeloides nanus TaxID=290746 RepID=A0A914D058_9BILA
MLTDCSNTIPPSHFKPQSVGQEPANQKPIPAPRQETPKQQKKYQTEQHPKAQQRIHHNHELPKSTAPPLPEKNRSPKPVKTAPEETQPVRKIPPIPKMLQDKKPKK